MKTLTTCLLVAVLWLAPYHASAPPVYHPDSALVVGIVLGITVLIVGGTVVYSLIKCAKKLNPPPVIESSTNNVTWRVDGRMTLAADGMEFVSTNSAGASAMFFRARWP